MAARMREVYAVKAPEDWTAEEMAQLQAGLQAEQPAGS